MAQKPCFSTSASVHKTPKKHQKKRRKKNVLYPPHMLQKEPRTQNGQSGWHQGGSTTELKERFSSDLFFFFLSYGTKKKAPEMRFCNLKCRQRDFVRRGASVQTSGCKKSAGKTHHDLEYGEAKSEKRAIIFLCSLKYLPPLWRRILAKSTHVSVHK